MLKECNVLGKQVSQNDADVIFAHHVKPGQRKVVDYDEWIKCLDEVGSRMRIGPYGVKRLIVMGGGIPKHRGTLAYVFVFSPFAKHRGTLVYV